MKGFALGLALKQRRKATWKSPIDSICYKDFYSHCFQEFWLKILQLAQLPSLVRRTSLLLTSSTLSQLEDGLYQYSILHRFYILFLKCISKSQYTTKELVQVKVIFTVVNLWKSLCCPSLQVQGTIIISLNWGV